MTAKTKIERLKEQKSKLEARIKMAEARTKSRERQNDLRRKILLGNYCLDSAAKSNSMDELKRIMDSYLKRDNDRVLFGLNPKQCKK
jgi:hypothetical protein